MGREEAFGMELHTRMKTIPVPGGHEEACRIFPGDGPQGPAFRQVTEKRVVTARGERARHASEEGVPIVAHLAGPSMHRERGADGRPAIGLA